MVHSFGTETRTAADGASVLSVIGELDIASAPQFRETVGELMGTGVRNLVVDLSESPFVDSSGIGAVLWAQHRLRGVGGLLLTTGAARPVARAFELAGLGEMVHDRVH